MHQLDHLCIRGITANRFRCEQYSQSTVSLATALNPFLYRLRQAAAEIVKESIATGCSIILAIAREKNLLTGRTRSPTSSTPTAWPNPRSPSTKVK